jgi:energy-coupling factor transporter ATP-binding protein EcfA2
VGPHWWSVPITGPEDLKGRTFVTPQLGNTQDVAFRAWLKENGLSSDVEGGGEVSITPQANAEGLAAYASGQIDGAWVPEPWVSEYLKAGAQVLVDETTLWPQGQFVTTHVIVRTEFLEQYPDAVAAFLDGHLAALAAIEDDPTGSAEAANASLQSLTGSSLDPAVLTSAWANVQFIADPLPDTLKGSAEDAVDVGLLDAAKVEAAGGLGTLYDLTLLNDGPAVRAKRWRPRDHHHGTQARRLAWGCRPRQAAVAGRDQQETSATGARCTAWSTWTCTSPGEFVTVVGASGCGKSTLLNLIAGLDRPTSGDMHVVGRVAFMFQDATLLPWLNRGAERGARAQAARVPRRERRAGPRSCWRSCGSGRGRQASARAVRRDASAGGACPLPRPGRQVVLMDEPLGALDAMTRDHLHDEIERCGREQGLTVLFVTHNMREAVRLGRSGRADDQRRAA